MKRIKLYIILVFSVVFMLLSCSRESLIEVPQSEIVELRVPLTRSPSEEDDIANARIIIFGGQGNHLLVNRYKDGADISFTELVPTGKLDIYLVANELASWDLNSVTSVDQLKYKVLTFSAYPTVNSTSRIPMLGMYERATIKPDGSLTMNGRDLNLTSTGTVFKLYSKVLLSLNCFFKDLPDNQPDIINTIELESVSIKNMPRKSWLTSAQYTMGDENDFFNGADAPLTDVIYDYTNPDPNKRGFRGEFGFYIPEYIVSQTGKYSYISVVARMKKSPHLKLKYRLVIGDGISSKSNAQIINSTLIQDFNITRNTCYKFVVSTIRSYGEVDGMEVFQFAQQWDNREVPGDVHGRVLNVSEISATVTRTTTVKIYFSSNQPEVFIEPIGYLGTTGSGFFTVNGFFDDIAGRTSPKLHYNYNSLTKSGMGYIEIGTISDVPGSYTHRININAGGLKREIIVKTNI